MKNTKNCTDIYGFAILRNGVQYDYPFKECLESMSGVCSKTYLALGKSDDNTENEIKKIENLKIKITVWDLESRKGGLVLSQQTNLALDFLKADHGLETHAWGFYLQCDEVIHENDYELLKKDFDKAQEEGADAISFRYLHFWQSHQKVAVNKKWYPQEIRAVKLNSDARSWGDAQSFENVQQIYQSEVIIYHYGHVREEEKYLYKKSDILKLYHSDEKMKKYKKREKKFDKQTVCLNFLGKHPKVMKERILRHKENWDFPTEDLVYIVGSTNEAREVIEKTINAKKVYFVDSLFEVPITHRNNMILVNPNFFQKIWYGIKTPKKMYSKLALPWSDDVYLKFLLYEKGISTN